MQLCRSQNTYMLENMFDKLQHCQLVDSRHCLMVRYEDLILHPKAEMRRILDFLNLSWSNTILHHNKHLRNPTDLSKYVVSFLALKWLIKGLMRSSTWAVIFVVLHFEMPVVLS